MNLTGKLTRILPLESGTTKAGKDWQKQSFVLEYQGLPIRMDQTETVRGGINLSQLDRLRHYWAQHGLPTAEQIDEHNKKVRVQHGS